MDIALNLAASDFVFAKRRKAFSTYPIPGPFYYAMILNLKDPIFRDIRTRLALDHAINKDSIVRKQLKGNGEICTGPFDINSWSYNQDVEPTPYSLERANELLKAAGWKNGGEDGVLRRDTRSALSEDQGRVERPAAYGRGQSSCDKLERQGIADHPL